MVLTIRKPNFKMATLAKSDVFYCYYLKNSTTRTVLESGLTSFFFIPAEPVELPEDPLDSQQDQDQLEDPNDVAMETSTSTTNDCQLEMAAKEEEFPNVTANIQVKTQYSNHLNTGCSELCAIIGF